MNRTFQKIKRATSIKNIRKAVTDPQKIPIYLRGVHGSIKKDRMDMDAEREAMASRLGTLFDEDEELIKRYQREIENNDKFYSEFERKRSDLNTVGEWGGTTSMLDAQTMYVVCRVLQPDIVIETGVRYGSFDAHVTAALERNNNGVMYGIDLADAIDEFEFGYLIPEKYRSRWELRLGDATDILPHLLSEVGSIDVFLHDSLHTPAHMRTEYEVAYPNINHGGVLASHDVLMTSAFGDFCDKHGLKRTRVRNIGVSQK